MLHLLEVQDFLQKAGRGEIDSSRLDDLIEAFGEDCKTAIRKQFSRNSEYRIRMSGLGRPLCQQQLEKQGLKQDVAYNDVIRFLIGDLVEAAAILVMKAAGVNVQQEQGQCSLELDGQTVNGTLDVIIDDKVWDIKSTSPWSFENKFSGRGGYDAIKEDDPFGYIMQGFLYSESQGLPFGGWIAINKSSGEWDFVEAPDNQDEDRETYLKEAAQRVRAIVNDAKFKIPFTSLPETYTYKGVKYETGNRLMPKTCTFCSFKENCWKSAEYHPKITSKAKNPPMTWYTKLVKKEL
jgi:hypothetical protein|tara:strand:+ start:751 stop:1629 length:879 start_codon:yes stop_codon:yes gene_type:complete